MKKKRWLTALLAGCSPLRVTRTNRVAHGYE